MGYSSLKERLNLPSLSYVYMGRFPYLAVILIWIGNSFQTHKRVLHFISYIPLKRNPNYWLFLAILLLCILTFITPFKPKAELKNTNWSVCFQKNLRYIKVYFWRQRKKKSSDDWEALPWQFAGCIFWRLKAQQVCDLWGCLKGEWRAHGTEPGKEGAYRKWEKEFAWHLLDYCRKGGGEIPLGWKQRMGKRKRYPWRCTGISRRRFARSVSLAVLGPGQRRIPVPKWERSLLISVCTALWSRALCILSYTICILLEIYKECSQKSARYKKKMEIPELPLRNQNLHLILQCINWWLWDSCASGAEANSFLPCVLWCTWGSSFSILLCPAACLFSSFECSWLWSSSGLWLQGFFLLLRTWTPCGESSEGRWQLSNLMF